MRKGPITSAAGTSSRQREINRTAGSLIGIARIAVRAGAVQARRGVAILFDGQHSLPPSLPVRFKELTRPA
jgi:hypothetical protein